MKDEKYINRANCDTSRWEVWKRSQIGFAVTPPEEVSETSWRVLRLDIHGIFISSVWTLMRGHSESLRGRSERYLRGNT